jgi:hypothetical protein
VKGISSSIMLLLAAGMTLSSTIALVYSLFSRLSADLLLRAMSYSRANSDVRDEGGVDDMMMEYMTALMQQTKRLDERSQSLYRDDRHRTTLR